MRFSWTKLLRYQVFSVKILILFIYYQKEKRLGIYA